MFEEGTGLQRAPRAATPAHLALAEPPVGSMHAPISQAEGGGKIGSMLKDGHGQEGTPRCKRGGISAMSSGMGEAQDQRECLAMHEVGARAVSYRDEAKSSWKGSIRVVLIARSFLTRLSIQVSIYSMSQVRIDSDKDVNSKLVTIVMACHQLRSFGAC